LGPAAGGDLEDCTKLYRVVHRWPMLGGLPVPLFLLLTSGSLMSGFGVSLMGGGLGGVGLVVLVAGSLWAILLLLFQKDQVVLPLFVVRRRAPLCHVITSFRPSWSRVVYEEDGPGARGRRGPS
jgi:hypothetical protein